MPDDRLSRLAHRFRLLRKARGIDRVRRRMQRTLDGLGRVRTLEWADVSSVSRNGTEIRQRIRATAMQQLRIAKGEWTPRRELAVGGWE